MTGQIINRDRFGWAVMWENGWESSMPSEEIARRCVASAELLEALKLMYSAWEMLLPCLKNNAVQDYHLVCTKAPCAAASAIEKATSAQRSES